MERHIDLIGYLEGSLKPEDKLKADSHLQECDGCAQELSLFKSSEKLMMDVARERPDFFCPAASELMDSLTGDLSPQEGKVLQAHIAACSICRQQLADLRECMQDDDAVSEVAILEELPSDLKANIEMRKAPVSRRAAALLATLKTKASGEMRRLLEEVETLIQDMIPVGYELAPRYALERQFTLPSETDLEFRALPPLVGFTIEIAGYDLEINVELSGVRIKVSQGGRPEAGVTLQQRRKDGEMISMTTDANGEVFIKKY